eukprot:GILI01016020.1.p1 GENE.GILI01016020.1~~GILI01016020.1.p1  ORF type:complete len:379 (+),score=78.73 GILI01016020.1:101-1138(+)
MASSSVRTALQEVAVTGEFKRVASTFREVISKDHPIFKPEAGRYHLYISYACPWACRCETVRQLKGLTSVIGLSVVHPVWQQTKPSVDSHTGWVFRSPSDAPVVPVSGYGNFSCEGCIPDTINNAATVRELYELSNDTNGKYSVPVLWDKTTKQIVNNESSEIIRMFNTAFNDLPECGNPSLDLYPEHLRAQIDEVNDWVYNCINNGVYKCGFAKSQEAYNVAVTSLYEALDRVESMLANSRFLLSNTITDADVRLFQTLVRFDEVYVVYFKCNKKQIAEYPNMRNYLRDIYQSFPGVTQAVHMDHIKHHYFASHPVLNSFSIVPVGPNVLADLAKSHDRLRFTQ